MTAPSRKTTVGEIGEFPLIQRIRDVLSQGHGLPPGDGSSEVILGLGDDAAVLRPERGWDWVVTCDVQVAGRHFLPQWMDARAIGRRAMTVNLSDLAAMGAEPRFAVVSLGLPRDMPVTEVEDLYRGFLDRLADTGAVVVGGNLTSTGVDWFCDITLIGRVEEGRALTRAGAKPGDRVLVTGFPGRSAAGLALLERLERLEGSPPPPSALERFLQSHSWARPLTQAYLDPAARLGPGRHLATLGAGAVAPASPATALIDLSDGLAGDLLRICEQSRVRARISPARLPADPELEQAEQFLGSPARRFSLLPSDDYELLFTILPEDAERTARDLREHFDLPVTEIGEILAPEDLPTGRGLVEIEGFPPEAGPPAGWDHFRQDPPNKAPCG